MNATKLPTNLHPAYEWTNAGGELEMLANLADGPGLAAYCAASVANFAQNPSGESFTALELEQLRGWLRANRGD